MRIRILQGVSGVGFSWAPGDLVDLDDDEAAKWADGYRAELAPESPSTPTEPPDGGPYDPSTHPIKDVLAYLQDVGEQEATRVLQLEAEGEDRRGIAREREAILERARAVDQAAAEQAAEGGQEKAEKAAEASRGGGRGDAIETR